MSIKTLIIKDLGLDGITEEMLTVVPKKELGDYSLPCFNLAKEKRMAPNLVAEELAKTLSPNGVIEKIANVGPYLNVWLDKNQVTAKILEEVVTSKQYGNNKEGKGKTVCIDFSSVNLAKHMHIGHLCTTIIGACIARLNKYMGYKVVSINYIGDYGTPFGKLITAYKRWGDRGYIDNIGVDAIQDLYVKFCQLEDEDPSLIEEARDWFVKIEKQDPEALELYNWIIGLSMKEANNIYDMLGIKFDSWRGESYYSNVVDDTISLLQDKGLAVRSEGALVVDLNKFDLGMFLVQKSDGSSLYSTRDIAAAMDRYENYHFHKSLYVTDTAQNLHFKSLFKTLELMGYSWAKDMIHVNYGRLSTPSGKIASRRGKVAVLKDIFETAETKANEVVAGRNISRKVAKDVGVSAIVFGLLKTERVKDAVFDIDAALNFEGETSVYLQYTNARINSIFDKAGKIDESKVDYSVLNSDIEFEIVKHLDKFKEILASAIKEYEPCYIARYLIGLATHFNKFYNDCRVITEDEVLTNSRLALIKCVQKVMHIGMKILGVKIINKM